LYVSLVSTILESTVPVTKDRSVEQARIRPSRCSRRTGLCFELLGVNPTNFVCHLNFCWRPTISPPSTLSLWKWK